MANQAKMHHSVDDWDFSADTWDLTDGYFVSPPTSLVSTDWPTKKVLCRHPDTWCIPYGRLSTWFRLTQSHSPMILFRNQAPIGEADQQNTYYVTFHPSYGVYLVKVTDGETEQIGHLDYLFPINGWHQVRVSWYQGIDLYCHDALVVMVESWDGENWISQGFMSDPNPSWTDSGINRVGLELVYDNEWIDDTVIEEIA